MPKDQPATQAQQAIADAREGLDTSWTQASDPVTRFEGFRALDDDAKAAWLAIVVASSLEAKDDYNSVKTNLPMPASRASSRSNRPNGGGRLRQTSSIACPREPFSRC